MVSNFKIKILATTFIIQTIDRELELLCIEDSCKMEYLLIRKQINQQKINTLQNEIQKTTSA